ncbi:MAG: hypothetical protein J6J22_07995 [Alistipes sp.]|nr:hypothetical protein [Alistipes sp.]
MVKNSKNFGGGIFYLAPQIEVTLLEVEQGFAATLQGLYTEEGDGWGAY